MQSFLDGSLTRLLDPDTTLRGKIVEFVGRGDFGLASGQKPDGGYERVWFKEPVSPDEVAFEPGVFLLTKAKAQALKAPVFEPISGPKPQPGPPVPGPLSVGPTTAQPGEPEPLAAPALGGQKRSIRLVGTFPYELWNRLGTKLLPKLRSAVTAGGQGSHLKVNVDLLVTVNPEAVETLKSELGQILEEMGLLDKVQIDAQ